VIRAKGRTTISAAATDMPSTTVSDCEGAPQFHEVPARITLETDDGRLSTSVIVVHPVELGGVLQAPTWVVGSIPASILAGTGVVSDEAIGPSSSVNVYLEVIATAAGRAYGAVSLKLVMPTDEMTVAVSAG
jgi:hypothetical protein